MPPRSRTPEQPPEEKRGAGNPDSGFAGFKYKEGLMENGKEVPKATQQLRFLQARYKDRYPTPPEAIPPQLPEERSEGQGLSKEEKKIARKLGGQDRAVKVENEAPQVIPIGGGEFIRKDALPDVEEFGKDEFGKPPEMPKGQPDLFKS